LECLGARVDSREPPALELRRRIVLVFQRPLLLTASVHANVAYGLKLRGRGDVDARVEQALSRVGLRARVHSPARTLSGGEAQRVALARALAIEPDVLLLDEPTANLDPYNVGLIEQIIQEARATKLMTLVLVTHNVFQARRLAGRVGLLLNGDLVEVGTTEEFFESPIDPRARAFVRGEMVW
jgi:tungstate transport system ATP-binding protein